MVPERAAAVCSQCVTAAVALFLTRKHAQIHFLVWVRNEGGRWNLSGASPRHVLLFSTSSCFT